MPQRNVATNFTFEQQRTEINSIAQDYWTFQGNQTTANATFLKADGTVATTAALTLGGHLNVPNAFTINSNSGNGTVTINGNLQVDGTTTTVNTATMDVVDKNITIAKGSANDAAADGAGITIDSATDITWNFVDAKDAWVSSIGIESSTTLKCAQLADLGGGRFTTANTAATGVGVEITQPDANTGNIQVYDRTNSAFKDLRLKGASVGLYAGSTNALVGAFHNTGLTMESGKTITGVLATAAQTNITSLGTLTSLDISGGLDVDGTTDLDVTNVDGALTMLNGWNLLLQNGFNNKTSAIVNSGATGKSNLEFKVDDGGGLDKRLSILNTGTVKVNKGGGIGMSLVPANNTDTFQVQFDLADTTNKGYVNYDFNTDKMKFRAGGSGDQLVITNGGLGIGTDSPGQLLEINGASSPCVLVKDTTNNVISYMFADDSNAFFGSASNHPVIIQQHNGAALTINTSKNATFAGTVTATSFSGDGSNLTGIAAGATIADSGNANANSTILFSANATGSNQTLSTDSGLLYNAAEDALKVNGLSISGGGINGSGNSLILSAANHSSTCKITVGQDVQVLGKFIQGAASTNSNTIFHTEGSASVGAEFIGNNTQEGFYLALRNKNTNNDAWTTIQSWDAGGAIVSSIRFVQVNDANNQGAIAFRTRDTGGSETERLRITPGGNVEPGVDNTYNLGSSSLRWANVYTGDMHLNNMNSGGNEVDGSEGHWTMQEGADDLFLINRNTGKKYKFNLTEVS